MNKYKYILASVCFFMMSATTSVKSEMISSLTQPNEDIVEITNLDEQNTNELIDYNKTVGKELVKAIDEKRLLVSQEIEIYLVQLSIDGYCLLKERKKDDLGNEIYLNHKTYGSKELMKMLLNLVESKEVNSDNPLIILSLFRFGGNHGEIQLSGDIIGRAVDIYSYAGYKINIEKPDLALQGIVKILNELPSWRYNVGLPRPGGGNTINSELDYFLPVTNIKQARRSPTGTIKGDLELIKNPEAKKLLSDTILSNKNTEILYMFPDETNHIHIKALENGKMQ